MPSKLEESWKSGLAQACTTDMSGYEPASLRSAGQRLRREGQSAKPGTDGSPLFFDSPGHISWFVPTARSRLTGGPSRPPTPESPLMTGPSQQAAHQHRYWHVGRLVAALPQRLHLCLSPHQLCPHSL